MTKKVPCEVYSRIVGYFRPVQNWNIGKKKEFDQRVEFDLKESNLNPTRKLEVKCPSC